MRSSSSRAGSTNWRDGDSGSSSWSIFRHRLRKSSRIEWCVCVCVCVCIISGDVVCVRRALPFFLPTTILQSIPRDDGLICIDNRNKKKSTSLPIHITQTVRHTAHMQITLSARLSASTANTELIPHDETRSSSSGAFYTAPVGERQLLLIFTVKKRPEKGEKSGKNRYG